MKQFSLLSKISGKLSPRSKKLLRRAGIASSILLGVPVLFFLLVYFGVFGKVYTGEELKAIQNATASEVFSSDKQLLGKYYWENRSDIHYKEIPPQLIHALIATEDARFYEHEGVDFRSLMRVFFKTLLMQEKNSGGGSTIGQQLSKNLFKRQRYGILTMPVNKIKEAIHAVRFTKVYTREEVLEMYLNTVSFGEDTYGIKNAALRFFDASLDSLKTEEMALLVGLLKSPTRFNPRLHPKAAVTRRNVVLENMKTHEYLDAAVADSMKRIPLDLHYSNATMYGKTAPYFVRHLEPTILEIIAKKEKPGGGKYNLYTDGLKIYTTIDYELQTNAVESMQQHMRVLQNEFYRHWGKSNPWGKNNSLVMNTLKKSPYYKSLEKEGLTKEEIEKKINVPVEMHLFNWEGGKEEKCSPLDSIKHCLKLLHAGILAMDPYNGEIKVWVGGNDYRYFQYDHVLSKRQVGSTFKPIVYATALEQGASPCNYYPNEKKVYEEFENWSPDNADGVYGGKYSMKGALANSVNVVSVQVLLEAGIDKTLQTARRMGIESPLPPVPSIALGTADISLMEMVTAYCTFPNGGKKIKPKLISRIEDKNGRVLYEAPNKKEMKRVFSEQTAYYMTQMMKAVVNEGTAGALRGQYGLYGDIGGKTGTTQSQADGWFIGYTPQLVMGVWVGAENPAIHFRSLVYGQGSHMALPIWGLTMSKNAREKVGHKYLGGSFRHSGELDEMPSCEPFVEDTFLDKLKDVFGIGEDANKSEEKSDNKESKKRRKWNWWRKE